MAGNGMIGGGRFTRAEISGDSRNLSGAPVSRRATLLRLWHYLGRSRRILIPALLLSVASGILGLLGPKLSGLAINEIERGAGKIDMAYIGRLVGLMLLFYALSAVLSYLLSRLIILVSKSVVTRMRHDLFDRLADVPVGFYDRFGTGDIISIVTYDVDTVSQALTSDLLQILQTVITVVVSFLMMLTMAPILLLVFVITIPAILFFTAYISKRVRPLFRRRSRRLGEMNGYAEEMLTSQKTTKIYGREAEVLAQFDAYNAAAAEAYTEAEAKGTVIGPTVNLINNLSLAMISIFGSLLFLGGRIHLGDLSAFIQYSRKFSGPISEIANIAGELQSAIAAAERIFSLMDAPKEAPDAVDAGELTDVRGAVSLSHVDFGYTEGVPVIRDFSLEVEPGSLIAIVGPTGAGKTTVINLLMRFYDPLGGRILIDGKDIRTLTRSSVRQAYSMVLQDTWLFTGTVLENIAYSKPDATREEVEAAAKAAFIHHTILAMEHGYDTVLSDNGTAISGGQKQLLTIARAMLSPSPILILDEATSHVDTGTEEKIQAAMRSLMKNKTCFVIAHRLSTIRSADHILVMRDGAVVEEGTHELLLRKKGFYHQLYYSQFEVYQ